MHAIIFEEQSETVLGFENIKGNGGHQKSGTAHKYGQSSLQKNVGQYNIIIFLTFNILSLL